MINIFDEMQSNEEVKKAMSQIAETIVREKQKKIAQIKRRKQRKQARGKQWQSV